MITAKEQSNKPLISITDGKKLGEIKGLYLDNDMRQVAGVRLRSGRGAGCHSRFRHFYPGE